MNNIAFLLCLGLFCYHFLYDAKDGTQCFAHSRQASYHSLYLLFKSFF
jgi:hypothetical protein